jgi:hypothetical protein
VQLNPSLEEIQKAINKAATAVLRCSKTLYNWDQSTTEDDKKQSLFEMITQDKEIVGVIILLTGSIQGTKNKINESDFMALQEFAKGYRGIHKITRTTVVIPPPIRSIKQPTLPLRPNQWKKLRIYLPKSRLPKSCKPY